MVPLRCAILNFNVEGGVMKPSPLTIDTEVSKGQGSGQIALDGETVALRLDGVSKGGAVLSLVDPIRVGGTLSNPAISLSGSAPGRETRGGGVLRAIGRSIGSALGIRDEANDNHPPTNPRSVNCRAMIASALR